MPLNQESISFFRQSFREQFSGNPSQSPIYEAISQAIYPNGIEYYLPLFLKKQQLFLTIYPKTAPSVLSTTLKPMDNNFGMN